MAPEGTPPTTDPTPADGRTGDGHRDGEPAADGRTGDGHRDGEAAIDGRTGDGSRDGEPAADGPTHRNLGETRATREALLRAFLGPDVLAVFTFLVGPLAAGRLDATLMTPLALPGYLLLAVGSAVGRIIVPQYGIWLYWVPFVVGSYALAVVATAAIRPLWERSR